ncbi:MAG TPA: DUF3465 domain-containing protein [Xanthomonadales bacterium]|nr:DUF3465 domain-containing protein [Xanthomonadales bacterium]
MKKVPVIFILLLLAYYVLHDQALLPGTNGSGVADNSRILQAFQNHENDVQVRGTGEVVRILSDDNDGSRHQRFILEVGPRNTVLVAHNIDLAPRVSGINVGDSVEFYGVYEWNERGGVIHWTHHDPQGRHIGGWLKHQGRTYE